MRASLTPPARRVPGSARRSPLSLLVLSGLLTLGGLTALSLPGCSLAIMTGKMLFGDPTETPPFEAATQVDLTDGEHTVLVLATSPESVKVRFPEVDQEIVRRVGRTLRSKGVDVANSDDVLDWVEERGGIWSEAHLGPIAEEFDVDYIIVVDLDRFDWFETNSPDLFRGRSGGMIQAYGAAEEGGSVSYVMGGEFESVYPPHQPKSAGSVSAKVFREQYLDRLCDQASQRFVPYRRNETIY